jgi:hypothetical protein
MTIARSIARPIASRIASRTTAIGGGGSPVPLMIVNDFADRLVAADASAVLADESRTAYMEFIRNGVNNGWLDHMLEIATWEGGTLASAAEKLVYRSGDPSALTNVGYTLSDLNTNGGCKASGTSARWTTINGLSAFPDNIGGVHAFLRETLYDASANFVTIGFIFLGWRADLSALSKSWGSVVTGPNDKIMGRGLYSLERQSHTNLIFYINNALYGTNTSNQTNTSRDGTIQYAYAPSPVDLVALSDGQMSLAERQAFTQATATLMLSLGRTPPVNRLGITLITGQSNASSGTFAPRITTSQPYFNTRNPRVSLNNIISNFSPASLIEITNETIASGMANTVSKLRRAATLDENDTSFDMAVDNVSAGGLSYGFIKKGTSYYAANINNASEINRLSNLLYANVSTVNAVAVVHGESDGGTTYATDIATWQADYETDLLAITGESKTVPMLHSQVSSFAQDSLARSTYAMLAAHEANPSKTILVCPKYAFTYADGIHLNNTSMRLLGDYYGKALYALMSGGSFSPLRPTSLVRSGAVITISFAGRVGDLVLDDTTIDDPGNFGFEWIQVGGTARAISSIALVNSNTQVEITLDGDPGAPSTQSIIYAGPASAGNATGSDGGPTTGPRGCVRDSDATEGFSEIPLWNWLVHFEKTVS